MLLVAWLQAWRGATARATSLRHLALRFAFGYGLMFLGMTLLKINFDYPRPVIALGAYVRVIGTQELRYSFPSGHSAYAALLAATAWPILGRAGRSVALAFVLWIAWSRIAAGAHFPADVVGGAFIGLVSAIATRWFLQLQQRYSAKQSLIV
jgi:signal peptidase II